jgi:hypothetical protein
MTSVGTARTFVTRRTIAAHNASASALRRRMFIEAGLSVEGEDSLRSRLALVQAERATPPCTAEPWSGWTVVAAAGGWRGRGGGNIAEMAGRQRPRGGGAWDVFADDREVGAADGRVVDAGSFRGAGAFLDEHLNRDEQHSLHALLHGGRSGSHGAPTSCPCTRLIFRRLRALAEWGVPLPGALSGGTFATPSNLGVVSDLLGFGVSCGGVEGPGTPCRNDANAGSDRDLNTEARENVLDREPPLPVRAYRQQYRTQSAWLAAGVMRGHLRQREPRYHRSAGARAGPRVPAGAAAD